MGFNLGYIISLYQDCDIILKAGIVVV